jgi:hypothetical protein
MDTLFIPTEQDFKRWVTEAVKECLKKEGNQMIPGTIAAEPVLSRKEIAALFKISLVTLHDWMKRGLPFHKQRGRVFFFRSEVLAYITQRKSTQW